MISCFPTVYKCSIRLLRSQPGERTPLHEAGTSAGEEKKPTGDKVRAIFSITQHCSNVDICFVTLFVEIIRGVVRWKLSAAARALAHLCKDAAVQASAFSNQSSLFLPGTSNFILVDCCPCWNFYTASFWRSKSSVKVSVRGVNGEKLAPAPAVLVKVLVAFRHFPHKLADRKTCFF